LVLERVGPLHGLELRPVGDGGYAIRRAMAERTRGAVTMDPGGLYRLIGRMERDGLVHRAESPEDESDERRQYLSITEWGSGVLSAEARRIACPA
jgi:DNA-binding PadR family transcriptional regulator